MRTPNVSEAKEKIQVIKYLDVGDMTITGSGKVSDKAFYAAKTIILTITAKHREILSKTLRIRIHPDRTRRKHYRLTRMGGE